MTQFVITSLGESVASVATPTGPWINIVEFRIGSNYDTPPSVFDTDLKGGTLYSAAPSSYARLDTDTIGIRCELPANVGPFTFGEIGLYLPGGVLFARASFGAPQHKLAGSVVGIPNAWRFMAVLKLAQAPALFNINASSQNQLLEIADFGLLSPPGSMPGNPNACIVHEPNPWSESILLWKTSPNRWSIGKYSLMTVGALSEDSVPLEIKSPVFATLNAALTRQYLVQFANGDIRGVIGCVGETAYLSQSTEIRPAGSSFELFKADSPSFSAPRLTAQDFNRLAAMFNFIWAPSPVGEPQHGWGQSAIPTVADPNEPPMGWPLLTDRVLAAAQLLGLPHHYPLNTLQNDWSSDLASQMAQFSVLTGLVSQIRGSSPEDVPFESTERLALATSLTETPYAAIHMDALATFASEGDINHFFNSGGWLGFEVDMNEDNMVQTLQHWRLAQLGIIRMCANQSDSTGSLKIVCTTGDNIIEDPGVSGYHGLVLLGRRKLWSHMMPVATEPGTATDTGYILFELFATLMTTTTIKMEFHITDNTGALHSNATNTPPFMAECTFWSGRPNSSLLMNPVISHPTATVLQSSTWN